MANKTFERCEKKYLLTRGQYDCLLCLMIDKVEADDFGKYTVSNVYFDTRDYELIRTSLEKPVYKEKLRLRGYGTIKEDSRVFIELKKKYDGVVYKRRVPMALWEARKYLYYGIYPDGESQILREIDYTLKRQELKPMAFIAYERLAFSAKQDQDLRITFDLDIRARSYSLDLHKGHYGTRILDRDKLIMEIKTTGAMPVWLVRLLSELAIYPTSFSKYGTYYREHILENQRIGGLNYA